MKMRANVMVLVAACFCGATTLSVAYETQTHAYLTSKAFDLSDLGNANSPAVLTRLGLDRLDTTVPFSIYWNSAAGASYYDNLPDGSAPLSYLRATTDYEKIQMQQLAYHQPLSWIPQSTVEDQNSATRLLPIRNWVVRGGIREDDLKPGDYNPKDGPAPDPDPRSPSERVFNHFYDPVHDQPLTVVVAFGKKATDWALGTVDAFTTLSPDSSRGNHFSWADARNNMFFAMTAERDANSDGVRSAAEREADAEERLYRWATTFRSLGNVMHLLEDTAQPQHSRNDRHDPYSNYFDPERQAYEAFTNARLLGANNVGGVDPTQGEQYVRSLNGLPISQSYLSPPMDANGYPAVSFSTPLRFFTTRAKADTAAIDPSSRLGLADYTNRGFFTNGTLPDNSGFDYPPTPVSDGVNGYSSFTSTCFDFPNLFGRHPSCTLYSHVVPDLVQPGRSDVSSKVPVVAEGMWRRGAGFTGTGDFTIGPPVFQVQGDLAIPRAIAYSAGIVNYFFRGQLTVSAPADKTVGVLNQGAQHTMNAQGYPCVGTATTDGCAIFGFQYIRLNVLNSTPQITESGTAAVIPQNLSATAVGDVNDTNFHGPYLVAVAKYHRNTCYKPDLSGQRVQSYAPLLMQSIDAPVCTAGQVVRTAYQEVSVSKSIAATAAALNGTSATEFKFDFTADPIPVNATDLFIQVVYRGPMGDVALGQEPDAIAVGTMDVREPTFLAFWNNTDDYWNAGWHSRVPSVYPNEPIRDFWICGSSAPPKLLFEYYGVPGAYAMNDPILSSNMPGQVRLGIIYPPPIGASQFIARGTPVADPLGDNIPIPVRSTGNSGNFQQANKENVLAATLTDPKLNCGSGLPGVPEYWCYDTVLKRRGQIFGRIAQPLYLFVSDDAGDVDAPPALAAFSGIHVLSTGTNRFNTDTTLITCPGQPAPIANRAEDIENMRKNMRLIELLEEARDLGVSGEKEQ